MSSEECFTLQIGNYSNYIASHLWNIRRELAYDSDNGEYCNYMPYAYHSNLEQNKFYPRTIAVDFDSNLFQENKFDLQQIDNDHSILWSGKTTKVINQKQSAKPANSTGRDRFHYWSDILQSELHSKSIYALPKACNSKSFQNFHSGSMNSSEVLNADNFEDILDRTRYFAEACNHLTTIQVIADLHDGNGGLTASLLQELREELGNNIQFTVWGMSNPYHSIKQPQALHATNANSTSTNSLIDMNTALCYNDLVESCNLFLPIDISELIASITAQYPDLVDLKDSKRLTIFTSAIIATAIESVGSFQHETELANTSASDNSRYHSLNHRNWSNFATSYSRFPICSVETFIPGITHHFQSSAGSNVVEEFVLQSLQQQASARAGSNDTNKNRTTVFNQHNTSVNNSILRNQQPLPGYLNTFTSTFSAVHSGVWSVNAAAAASAAKISATVYSNVINIRGDYSSGLIQTFMSSTPEFLNSNNTTTTNNTSNNDNHKQNNSSNQHTSEFTDHKQQKSDMSVKSSTFLPLQLITRCQYSYTPVFATHYRDLIDEFVPDNSISNSNLNTKMDNTKANSNANNNTTSTMLSLLPVLASTIGAIGATSDTAIHLQAVTTHFSNANGTVRMQLNKAGFSGDDSHELVERLLQLSSRYETSRDL